MVSYNLRAARELKGWTQEQFAQHLEAITGSKLTQAGVSALERTWEGGKRREFDAQELVDFATALDVPIVWFFLPPPGDDREIKNTGRPLSALIDLMVGRAHHLPPIEERLREMGVHDPTAEEAISRMLTGHPDAMTPQVIGELREKMLAQILDEMATDFDEVAHVVGDFWDRARQVTIRGMIAALTNNARLLPPGLNLPELPTDAAQTVDADGARAGENSREREGPTDADADEATAIATTARQA